MFLSLACTVRIQIADKIVAALVFMENVRCFGGTSNAGILKIMATAISQLDAILNAGMECITVPGDGRGGLLMKNFSLWSSGGSGKLPPVL